MTSLSKILQGQFGVERQVELVAPTELETSLRQGVVADGGSRVSLGQIGRMGGYLIGDDTCTNIVFIRQGQMILGGDVTQHSSTQPGYLCATYSTGDMVITWSNICYDGTEGVERCLVALLQLSLHVFTNLVHGHMSGALDKCLYILIPRACDEFAHGVEFGKLGSIVRVGCTSRSQSVAQRQGHIILSHNVADIIEVLVQETLLIVQQAPLAHDATTTTYYAAQSAIGQMNIVATYAGMDGEIIHTLLALLYERVAIHLPR